MTSHRDDEKRFVVRADEKLTAFLELEVYLVSKARYYICSRGILLKESGRLPYSRRLGA
jgi:hypothetical protein